MIVIEITKRSRNNTVTEYRVSDISPTDVEEIEFFVEGYVKSEPSGQQYGYDYEWKILTDADKITTILKAEKEETEFSIAKLSLWKKSITDEILRIGQK